MKAAQTPKSQPKKAPKAAAAAAAAADVVLDAVAVSSTWGFGAAWDHLEARAAFLADQQEDRLRQRVHELFTARMGSIDLVSGGVDLEAMRVEVTEEARRELETQSEVADLLGSARGAIADAVDAVVALQTAVIKAESKGGGKRPSKAPVAAEGDGRGKRARS